MTTLTRRLAVRTPPDPAARRTTTRRRRRTRTRRRRSRSRQRRTPTKSETTAQALAVCLRRKEDEREAGGHHRRRRAVRRPAPVRVPPRRRLRALPPAARGRRHVVGRVRRGPRGQRRGQGRVGGSDERAGRTSAHAVCFVRASLARHGRDEGACCVVIFLLVLLIHATYVCVCRCACESASTHGPRTHNINQSIGLHRHVRARTHARTRRQADCTLLSFTLALLKLDGVCPH